jgi:hypothetical protein
MLSREMEGTDRASSEPKLEASSCDHGNESSGSTRGGGGWTY